MYSGNLNQHTNGSTHKDCHTLDLVITRSDDDIVLIVSNLPIDSPFVIPDHTAIHFYLKLKKPVFDKKLITFRKLRSIDFNNFGLDVLNCSLPSLFVARLPCLDGSSNHSVQRRSKFYTRHPCFCEDKNCYSASCCSLVFRGNMQLEKTPQKIVTAMAKD